LSGRWGRAVSSIALLYGKDRLERNKEKPMLIVRECKEQDYERIFTLNCFLGYNNSLENTRKSLVKILSRPTDKIYVACIENKVIGYIQVSDYECTYLDSMKNIMALVVDEAYRKQGVGKALLQAAEVWADQCGCRGVRLNSAMNRTGAHAFYEHCGYFHEKDQKNFRKLF